MYKENTGKCLQNIINKYSTCEYTMAKIYQPARLEYQKSLEQLKTEVMELGKAAKSAFIASLNSLELLDQNMAKQLMKEYPKAYFSEKESEIEQHCIKLIATQSPVSTDLRLIESSYKVVSELKKISTTARKINQATINIKQEYGLADIIANLQAMAQKVILMIDQTLDIFNTLDKKRAPDLLLLAKEDDKIDEVYQRMTDEIIVKLAEHKDKDMIKLLLDLLLLARHIERAGYHSCNVAERVYYILTGKRTYID